MVEITEALEDHIEQIGELWMDFMLYHADMDAVYEPPENSILVFIDGFLRPAMEDDNSLVLVALHGEKAVGYSYSLIVPPHKLNKREKYGLIHDMFIARHHRRSGIGKELFAEIVRWFKSKGIHRIELDVMTLNHTASNFWEKMGFTDLNRTVVRQI